MDQPLTFVEKARRVNWSGFMIKIMILFFSFVFIPQIIFWLPYWLRAPGWELNGDPELPSQILSILYTLVGVTFVVYMGVMFDYHFNRETMNIRSDQITFEDIEIPVGAGHFLVGDIVRTPFTREKDAPVLIVCHGLGSVRQRNYQYGLSLSLLGFAVVFYDARGHGETAFGERWDGYYTIRDLNKVVNFVEKRGEETGEFSKNIIVLGFSMGGAVVLNEGYLDTRVKCVIACCTFGDYKMTAIRKRKNLKEVLIKAGYEIQGINQNPSDLQSRLVSPLLNAFNRKKGFFDHPVAWDVNNNYRVFLAHAEVDSFVNFENFEINRDALDLKPQNYIVFKKKMKADHKFSRGETALLGKMLYFLYSRGF